MAWTVARRRRIARSGLSNASAFQVARAMMRFRRIGYWRTRGNRFRYARGARRLYYRRSRGY